MATETVLADRQELAFHASCRLEALLKMLRREQGRDDADGTFGTVLDETLGRVSELAGAISVALGGGDDFPTDELALTVYGPQGGEGPLMDELHNLPKRAGAAAFDTLLKQIERKADLDLGEFYAAHPQRDGEDARDYGGLADMVANALDANLQRAQSDVRDGFLRALTLALVSHAEDERARSRHA